MSPLWRDEVGISLAPHHMALLRRARGLRPRVTLEKVICLQPGHFGDWSPALGALAGCLAEFAWKRTESQVIISDHWARYAVVPGSGTLSSEKEQLSAARYALSDVYGEIVDWEVTLADTPPGAQQVACALPRMLLIDLQAILDEHGLAVCSIQPRLVSSFNRWRHALPASGAWFVVVEEGCLAAAHVTNGRWDRVSAVRIGSDWLVELKRLQTFGRLVSSAAEGGRVYIEAPLGLREVATNGDDTLVWLESEPPAGTTAEQLALLQRYAP